MKLRTYQAADLRRALSKARQEQGPDVVIVSHRATAEGVELVTAEDSGEDVLAATLRRGQAVQAAAVSPPASSPPPAAVAEPTGARAAPANAELVAELRGLRSLVERQLPGLAWGDFGHRHPVWADLLRRLVRLGLHPRVAREMLEGVPESSDTEQAWRHALALLSQRLPVLERDLAMAGGVIALVGPTGVGKTTLVAKLAARELLQHGPEGVALVSVDRRRIGAFDQLRGYAQLLGLPVWTAGSEEELRDVLASVSDRRLVLIDTAGVGPRNGYLGLQMDMLRRAAPGLASYLVLAAPTLGVGLERLLAGFAEARPAGCMLTKLDEAASLGGVLSAVIAHGLPIAYVSEGQRIPDDLALPRAHRLVARAVQLAREAGESVDDTQLAEALGAEDSRACA